jgi:putative ABC transport system permease protein
MIKFWKLAFYNLRRNRRRNLATMISISFGLIGLMMFGGYVNRTDNFLRVYTIFALNTGHVAIYPKDGLDKFRYKPQNYSFDVDSQAKIEAILNRHKEKIDFYSKILSGTGLVGNGCQSFPFYVSSIEPLIDLKLRTHEQMLKWAPELSKFIKGRALGEYKEETSPLSISKGLARLLHKPLVFDDVPVGGNQIRAIDCSGPEAKQLIESDSNIQLLTGTWQGTTSALDGEIVSQFSTGFSETDQGALIAPLRYLQNLFDTDRIGHYSVWLRNPNKIDSVMETLKSELVANDILADTYPWYHEDLSPTYNGALRFLRVMIAFIGIVLSAIITLSILNSSTMTVTERSAEIGMMRALGFTRNRIRLVFIQEAGLVGCLGLFGGLLLGNLIIALINAQKIPFTPPGASHEIPMLLLPHFGFTVITCGSILFLNLLTTWFVVGQISRKNISHLITGHHG